VLLRESILQFHEGKLNEIESAEVSALVQSNPHARSILDGILAAERYGASPNGKAWLDGLLERVMAETPVAQSGTSTMPIKSSSQKTMAASFQKVVHHIFPAHQGCSQPG